MNYLSNTILQSILSI